jgi:hypothetical protein
MNEPEIIDAEFKVKEKEEPVRTKEDIVKEMEEKMNEFSIPQKKMLEKSDKIRIRIREKEAKQINDDSYALEQSIENDRKIYTNYMRNLGLLSYFTELEEVNEK